MGDVYVLTNAERNRLLKQLALILSKERQGEKRQKRKFRTLDLVEICGWVYMCSQWWMAAHRRQTAIAWEKNMFIVNVCVIFLFVFSFISAYRCTTYSVCVCAKFVCCLCCATLFPFHFCLDSGEGKRMLLAVHRHTILDNIWMSER